MSADDALHREIEERARAQGTSATGFGTHGGEVAPMLAPATETDHAHNNGARDADVPGYDGDGHGPTGYPSDHKTGYPQEKGGYAGQASSAGLGAAGLGAGAGAVAVGTHLHGNDHDNVVNDDEGVGQVSRAVAGRSSHDIDPAQHQRDSSLFHPHEAPGRENAHVVPHEEYVNRFGGHDDGDHHDHHAGAIGTGAAAGTGAALLAAPSLRRRSTAEQRENDPASAAYAQEQAAAPQEVSPTHGGYAGVGAIGYGDNDHHAPTTRKSRGNLQPSRSYINSRPGSTYAAPQTQENGHINDVGFAKVGGGDALNRQPSYAGSQRTARTSRTQKTHTIPDHTGKGSAVAVQPPVVLEGSGYDQHNGALPSHQEDTVGESAQPLHQHDHEPTVMAPVVLQQQYPVESGRQPSIAPSRAATQINGPTESAGMAQSPTSQNLGPTTAVRSAAQPDYLQQPGVGRPISGGGLGAALATSGHKLTHTDKKALKGEIKTEKRFSKNLQSEAKAEAAEIISQMKQCKVSNRRAQKAARFQGAFRGNYETAIKNEVKAKQKLLKITNYYNKIAADLESATKEMEIRRNAYQAECQTRDADILRLEHLRKSKGTNDVRSIPLLALLAYSTD